METGKGKPMSKWADKIDLRASEAESKAKMEAAARRRVENGREFFIRACMAEGIDPARGVSPSLMKLLGGKA